MKKMRKIFAVLLSLAMVLGMSMTTFADTKDSAEITVTNAEKATLTYLQVIKPDQTTTTGWAFCDEVIANAYTKAFGIDDPQAVIKQMTDNPDGNTDEIGRALSNVYRDKSAEFGTMNNPQTVNSAGVYAIHASEEGYTYNNMAAYIAFAAVENYEYPSLEDKEIEAKKTPTTVVKDNNDKDDVVAIGDVVTYTVKANVPFINPNDSDKTFFVYDNITGATYDLKDATVTMGGQEIDNEIILNDDKSGFSINLSDLINDSNSNAGKEIVVTYKAVVTGEVVNNEAKAGHKGGSNYGSDTTTTYTGTIVLTKYNEDSSKALAGAGFKVTKDDVATALTFTKVSDGVYVYDPAGTETEVFTGDAGTLTVKGLNVGKYHFEETTAPKGYSINETGADATLAVKGDTATAVITAETDLNDTKLSSLPSTGGIGTTIFTIGGCLIMIVAAGLFFASRRKSAQ